MTVTYQCEQCDDAVSEANANTKTYQGDRETVTLAFCPDCSREVPRR